MFTSYELGPKKQFRVWQAFWNNYSQKKNGLKFTKNILYDELFISFFILNIERNHVEKKHTYFEFEIIYRRSF